MSIITRQDSPRPGRAGVLPYTIVNGQLHFLFGVDRKAREYSDFGGGRKQDETFMQGAHREAVEELEGIIDCESVLGPSALAVWTTQIGIIFLPLQLTDVTDLLAVPLAFAEAVRPDSEMVAVTWIPLPVMESLVTGSTTETHPYKMYLRVKQLLEYGFRTYELVKILRDRWVEAATSLNLTPRAHTKDFRGEPKRRCRTPIPPPAAAAAAPAPLAPSIVPSAPPRYRNQFHAPVEITPRPSSFSGLPTTSTPSRLITKSRAPRDTRTSSKQSVAITQPSEITCNTHPQGRRSRTYPVSW